MSRCKHSRDLETLAKMAARLAGQVPNRRVTISFGDLVAFDDAAWRYPDFIMRAEAAYAVLIGDLSIEQSGSARSATAEPTERDGQD